MEDYERIKGVGRGAFGTVYLCRNRTDNRQVIIKEIPVDQLSTFDRQSTINEVKVLAMLHHPNIIEYYDNFIQDKAMMIVMEYAAGGTLYEYLESQLNQGKYLDEEEIGHLFAQIVLPLHMVHARNVLHRDLKSMNIFLTKSRDHIKIGDFGISKILTSKSKAITVVGTPNYISPELCEGKPYNQKSDIWALGCILYEMCTLKHPFEAPTLPALVLKIMRGTFNPLPAHYSTNLRDLLSSLLAVDPNQRPSLIQIMGHNWIAPYLYKLPTTLGRLACTAKPARPLSVAMTRHQQDNNFLLPRQEVENPRSPSPFSRGSRIATSIFKISLHGSGSATKLELPSKNSSCEQLEDICSVSHGMSLGTTREGLVLEWTKSKQPRILEGLNGITITRVISGGAKFFALLTDRGIMLTYGSGNDGCLGHNDFKSQPRPKIVEALLGYEIVDFAASETHIFVLTSDHEVFAWGRNESGCLGLGASTNQTRKICVPTQVHIKNPDDPDDGNEIFDDDEGEIQSSLVFTKVFCSRDCTALLTQDGELFVAGQSTGEQFLMKEGLSPAEGPEGTFVKVDTLGEAVKAVQMFGEKKILVMLRGGQILLLRGRGKVFPIATNIISLKCGTKSAILRDSDGILFKLKENAQFRDSSGSQHGKESSAPFVLDKIGLPTTGKDVDPATLKIRGFSVSTDDVLVVISGSDG